MAGKPIIVGTDGSEESMRAVEWAAREAALRRSPLRVVSVPAPPPRMSWRHPHGRPDAAAVEVVHQPYALALTSAAERVAELQPGLEVDTQLLSGPPARTLAETIADASMLVVGSRGTGVFSAMGLGSVSRYAATHSQCPVVITRQETSVHWEIVVGVGDLDQSAAALGFAFEEAALRKARLTVVHAWSCFLPAPGPGGEPTGRERAAANPSRLSPGTGARLQDILAGWQEKYPAVETGTEITHAHPAHLLAAASACADLVVLGRSAGAIDGPGVGSVIHAVLHHAHGPVAIVAG